MKIITFIFLILLIPFANSEVIIGFNQLDSFGVNIKTLDEPLYGEMWNYTSAGLLFDIDMNNIYYNYSGLDGGYLNGFTYVHDDSPDVGDKLYAEFDGIYKISFSMSFSSQAQGGLYGISLHHDHNPNTHRNCYGRREAATDTGNVGIECFMDLMAGEGLGIMIESENTNRDISVQTINLNIVKIGDM